MEKLESEGAFDPIVAADAYGSGALHWAAGGGHLAACDWLVNAANVPIDGSRRKDGRTARHWAARNGHLVVVAWLVEKGGADANRKTYDGDGAFSLAVWQGHLPVARYLGSLDAVDPGATNRWGCNALLWACIQHDPRGGGGGGSGTMARGRALGRRRGTRGDGPSGTNRHRRAHGDGSVARGELGYPSTSSTSATRAAQVRHMQRRRHRVALSETRATERSTWARTTGAAAERRRRRSTGLAAELGHVEDRTMRLPVVYDERVGDGA